MNTIELYYVVAMLGRIRVATMLWHPLCCGSLCGFYSQSWPAKYVGRYKPKSPHVLEEDLISKGSIAFIQIIVHLKKKYLKDFAGINYIFFILANASQF